MLRLFTGLTLPKVLRQRLQLLQGGIPGASWTHQDDFHVTLAFIGNVDEATAEDIDHILCGIHVPAFKLELKGTGTFSTGDRAGHLWIGVEPDETLSRLKAKIDQALASRGLPVDQRKYTPHVTLARLRNADRQKLADFMQHNNLFSSGPFDVESFILYRSHQANDGPKYEVLRSYPLTVGEKK